MDTEDEARYGIENQGRGWGFPFGQGIDGYSCHIKKKEKGVLGLETRVAW